VNADPTAQRNTKQRSAVSAVLNDVEGFNSAQELHEIDVMRPPGGEHLYRRCSQGHHHHLVCRACGKAVEVEGPAVESWADRVAAQHGYVDVSHTMEIFGTCPDCATNR
jgi:Fur family ferric uptake transcriptional regulator